MAKSHPALANKMAVARPIPLEPPVIKTFLPFRKIMESPPLFSYDLAAQQIKKGIYMLYAFSCGTASHWIYFKDKFSISSN
jgi:hypothetical protein